MDEPGTLASVGLPVILGLTPISAPRRCCRQSPPMQTS